MEQHFCDNINIQDATNHFIMCAFKQISVRTPIIDSIIVNAIITNFIWGTL